MVKIVYITAFFFMSIQVSFGQKIVTYRDSISAYFNEIKLESDKHRQLWPVNLNVPILLVDPDTRQLLANFPDTAGMLRKDGTLYSGILPNDINFSNTAVNWSGRRWAMVVLPLPANKQERLNLLGHESFHANQPSLGFILFNTENNHLDQKEGRIYLRLELEALKKAVQTTNKAEQKTHLANALAFRKYRYALYRGADSTENLLELNEGIAEYTGFVISGRNKEQSIKHFVQNINTFLNNPTFVRSFAYQTIPVYGYLLADSKKYWNKEITIEKNLADYFIQSFDISLPRDLKKTTDLLLNQYNGAIIISEEEKREKERKQLIAGYKTKFITQAHFDLALAQMSISFDPRNLMPLEDKGTVYPNIRVTDNWGILTVKNGALISAHQDKISVTVPLKNELKNITGDGWTLELKDGYAVTKNERTGNYELTKQ